MRALELGQTHGRITKYAVGLDREPQLARLDPFTAGGPSPTVDLDGALAPARPALLTAGNHPLAPGDQAGLVESQRLAIQDTEELDLLEVRADEDGHVARAAFGYALQRVTREEVLIDHGLEGQTLRPGAPSDEQELKRPPWNGEWPEEKG
jgi:hypothetical protein